MRAYTTGTARTAQRANCPTQQKVRLRTSMVLHRGSHTRHRQQDFLHRWLSSTSISSNRGANVWIRRSPAAVGDTLRLVRVSRRSPRRVSRAGILCLSADCETPIGLAAPVKLRSRATATKANRSLKSSLGIHERNS